MSGYDRFIVALTVASSGIGAAAAAVTIADARRRRPTLTKGAT
jgi:hypothetical protein